MAIMWEFTIISETAITLKTLTQISREYKDDIKVKSVFSLDDWEWSNQQKLDDLIAIEENLNNGKIITVEMQSRLWKSLGMYIEKEKVYMYTFWINTEGFPELDVDQITNENKKYYDYAYHILDRLIKKYDFPFEYIAIGLESDIQYCIDIKKMISNSNNVVVWLTKNNSNTVLPNELKRCKVAEGLDVIAIKR